MKYCSRCKETKDLTNFGNNKSKADGKQSYCKPCKIEQNNLHRRRYMRKYRLSRRYKLTIEQFDSMIKNQNNRCALCSQEFSLTEGFRIAPHVDHNHLCCPGKTSCGKCIRALLCGLCNSALGYFKDNATVLANASKYIDLHNKQLANTIK